MSDQIPAVFDSPVFRMACQQFDLVADYLEMPAAHVTASNTRSASITVALPIHRDDGTTPVFIGYRVRSITLPSGRPRAACAFTPK